MGVICLVIFSHIELTSFCLFVKYDVFYVMGPRSFLATKEKLAVLRGDQISISIMHCFIKTLSLGLGVQLCKQFNIVAPLYIRSVVVVNS